MDLFKNLTVLSLEQATVLQPGRDVDRPRSGRRQPGAIRALRRTRTRRSAGWRRPQRPLTRSTRKPRVRSSAGIPRSSSMCAAPSTTKRRRPSRTSCASCAVISSLRR